MKGFLRILKERKSCSSLFCTCLVCSQEELSRACRPNIGGVDEEVEAQPFLQAQASTCRRLVDTFSSFEAERELRLELLRMRGQRATPWEPLRKWLKDAVRSTQQGEVHYRTCFKAPQ